MASTILTRTVASTGNNKILTFSAWVKRCDNSTGQLIAANGDPTTANYIIFFEFTGGGLRFIIKSLSILANVETNTLFQDLSAWYHLVFTMDTTQATASDRVKMYVNGEQITDFALANYPSQNLGTQFNNVDSVISVGGKYVTGANTDFFNGSMSHVHLIDGTVYDADTFGETDATTGIWKPKTEPSVTYGTNGFFLKGENSGALGTDSSGNANNLTVTGTPTQTVDTPSNVFCTLNHLSKVGTSTYANGNTTYVKVDDSGTAGTLGASKGKYYWEYKFVGSSNVVVAGVIDASIRPTTNINNTGTAGYYPLGSSAWKDTTEVTTGLSGYSDGMIVGLAFDADNGDIYTWVNGVAENSGNAIITGLDTTKTWLPFTCTGNPNINLNFGNGFFGTTAVASAQNPDDGIGIFEYDVPAGYRALCTKSINAQEYS